MKKTVQLMLFLAIVSAIAGGILGYVNSITAPVIEKMAIAAEQKNLELLFPNGEFKALEFKDETGLVKGVYQVEGQGYVFKVETVGYNSSTPIVYMVAFSNEGNIIGFKELQQQETNGIGSRVFTDEYSQGLLKKTNKDNYDTLTGATVTSTAVVKGLNASRDLFNTINGLEKVETVEQEPKEVQAVKVLINQDWSVYDAQVTVDGSTYRVNAKGYGLLEGDSSHFDYVRNEFMIEIEDQKIKSITLVTFGDTPNIGDKAVDQTYLDQFIGKTMDDEVDLVTGATYTSNSVIASVLAALQAAGQ